MWTLLASALVTLRGEEGWGSVDGAGGRQTAPHALRVFQPNSSNDNIQSITSGDWDVTKILAYDEKRNKM